MRVFTHVSDQAVFHIKLLPTFITTEHLDVGLFFSNNIFERRHKLGICNVRTSQSLKLGRLLMFVAFSLVYPQPIVRFEKVSTNVTLETVLTS